MDPTIIFFIFAAAVGLFQAYSTFKTIRSHRIDDKDYKAIMHRTVNRINLTECVCSPECLIQSKMIRLDKILIGPKTPEPMPARFDFSRPAARVRPFQFIEER